ncbi:MAG: hypothetical protein Q8J69_01220 [Sphingobacteriaceae bacterium]|nr:hypothetical protein [Sphingobacteriaceae bacterium]
MKMQEELEQEMSAELMKLKTLVEEITKLKKQLSEQLDQISMKGNTQSATFQDELLESRISSSLENMINTQLDAFKQSQRGGINARFTEIDNSLKGWQNDLTKKFDEMNRATSKIPDLEKISSALDSKNKIIAGLSIFIFIVLTSLILILVLGV